MKQSKTKQNKTNKTKKKKRRKGNKYQAFFQISCVYFSIELLINTERYLCNRPTYASRKLKHGNIYLCLLQKPTLTIFFRDKTPQLSSAKQSKPYRRVGGDWLISVFPLISGAAVLVLMRHSLGQIPRTGGSRYREMYTFLLLGIAKHIPKVVCQPHKSNRSYRHRIPLNSWEICILLLASHG